MISLPLSRAAAMLLVTAAIGCSESSTPPPTRVPVTVAAVERRPVPFELSATGTVEPLQRVAVEPQVSGPVVRIAFTEGQDVRRGQVLFEIDPRPFRAALAEAEAILDRDRAQAANAEQEVARYAALAEKEYVTAQQYAQAQTSAAAAKATLAASQAAVEEARLSLQYATIRAPISGRTGSLRVREGNLVRVNDAAPLVTINQLRPILVRFAIPAANLPLIQEHRAGRVLVRAAPVGGSEGGKAPSEGTLSFVDNAVDTATGTILLKGTFDNTDGSLWPGEFVNVRVRLYVEENALVVPATAVVAGQQGSFVFVVQPDSSADNRPVRVSRSAGDIAVVTGDIEAGDRVVTDGQLRLGPGSKVQIRGGADVEADSASLGAGEP